MVHCLQVKREGGAKMNGKKEKKNQNVIKEGNLTYEDYASMNDQKRYELVNGKLELMSPSPSVIHQLVSAEIYNQLSFTCRSNFFIFYAPIDVILSQTEVRQPDIALVSQKRIDILTNRGIEGAPDLVIEIISPSSLKRDKIDKLAVYANYNISEYWIVDPNIGALEQYILKNNRYELADIFQNNDPVTSPHISCVSFTMNKVMEGIPDIN